MSTAEAESDWVAHSESRKRAKAYRDVGYRDNLRGVQRDMHPFVGASVAVKYGAFAFLSQTEEYYRDHPTYSMFIYEWTRGWGEAESDKKHSKVDARRADTQLKAY